MINRLLANPVLNAISKLQNGQLEVQLPDGSMHRYEGSHPGQTATITIHHWEVFKRLVVNGDVGLFESYRDGHWQTPNLPALLQLGMENLEVFRSVLGGNGFGRLFHRLRYLTRNNTERGSRRNIQAHYDLGNDFYSLWLDPGMTYSSALFDLGSENLETAQNRKYSRIIDCLNADSGRLLEIGCGWGGFANLALSKGDYEVTGITLSDQQYDYCHHRLGKSADIQLKDYRRLQGKFDHIVSIEMFEAVGENHWRTYFQKVADLMKKGGKAVIQSITIADSAFQEYRASTDPIRSYIFPGGMLPSPSKFTEVARQAGLNAKNEFHFGLDYALTLEHWLHKFESSLEQIRALGYDEMFIRIWRFYLASCIATFRSGRTSVMQVELSHA